jgi:hypothetical protein
METEKRGSADDEHPAVAFTLATDRSVHHGDTRCPEGATIKLKDRRPGDGGREPRSECARFLAEMLEDRLRGPWGAPPAWRRSRTD